jgi:hypothetical protein
VAFLALVVVGAVLAGLEPIAFVALIAVAVVLAALVERAYAREAGRARVDSSATAEALPPPEHVEAVDDEPPPEAKMPSDPPAAPDLAVSERTARAILASGPPPMQERQLRKPEPAPDPEPEPGREPEVEPDSSDLRPEWNLWELQRLVRERPDDDRQEEWTAMILSLRDFARVDGTLPSEFDSLVRDSFGTLLVEDSAHRESAAAP